MAKHPGIIDKVNYVVRFMENPCNAPWVVYFELAGPPLGKAIITLLSFGMDDIIRGFFKPKGLRSGRHGRRGRRGKGGKFRLPEIGEEIGKRLPGAEEAKGRSVTQGVKNLWLIDGVLQRVLYYWLIVDVTATFFYDWATLINESAYCRSQPYGAGLWQNGEFFLVGLAGWTAYLAPNVIYARGACQFNVGEIAVGPGNWTVILASNMSIDALVPQVYELAISETPSPAQIVGSSGIVGIPAGGSGQAIATFDCVGPKTLYAMHRCGSGGLRIDTSDVVLFEGRTN